MVTTEGAYAKGQSIAEGEVTVTNTHVTILP